MRREDLLVFRSQMKCWIVAVVLLAVVLLVYVFHSLWVWYYTYPDDVLRDIILNAYEETGKPGCDIIVGRIERIASEDSDGRSIYDIRVKFVGGEFMGRELDFRYTFLMLYPPPGDAGRVLTVDRVTEAPHDSPLKRH